jgi:hypothetical protein
MLPHFVRVARMLYARLDAVKNSLGRETNS